MKENERVSKTLSDLKNAQNNLDALDREHDELMVRLANARRAQQRMTYYLIAIVVVAAGMIIGSLYVAAKSLEHFWFMQKKSLRKQALNLVVPTEGLEPPHLAAHGPEPCASTNSATWAKRRRDYSG